VTLPHSSTVLQLKERIESIVEVPKHLQRLIFRGRVLKDDHTLQSYNILDNDVLHLV
ncbi:ubiquitin-like protein, partial [Paraphysoderma sedebokerense]